MPGITWQLKNDKFVIPRLYKSAWEQLIKCPWIINAEGAGLAEILCIMSILESWKEYYPDQKIDCACSLKWRPFFALQGKVNAFCELERGLTSTLPLYVIKEGENVIWQPLINYLKVKSWDELSSHRDARPFVKQLLEKSLLQKNNIKLPKWRFVHNFSSLYLKNKLELPKNYVLCILQSSQNKSISLHKSYNLSWKNLDIINLAKLRSDLNFVVISAYPINKSYLKNIFWISSFELENLDIGKLIEGSQVLFSNEIDWLYYGLLFSSTKIISGKYVKKTFNWHENSRQFHKVNPVIFNIKKLLTPEYLALRL